MNAPRTKRVTSGDITQYVVFLDDRRIGYVSKNFGGKVSNHWLPHAPMQVTGPPCRSLSWAVTWLHEYHLQQLHSAEVRANAEPWTPLLSPTAMLLRLHDPIPPDPPVAPSRTARVLSWFFSLKGTRT